MQLDGFQPISDCLRSGIYVLVAKGVVIYVGKSNAMIARINAHRRAWQDRKRKESWISEKLGIPGLLFDEIHIRHVPKHLLGEVEAEMIDRYKPRYNIQLKTSAKIRAPINITVQGIQLTLNAPPPQRPVIERRI